MRVELRENLLKLKFGQLIRFTLVLVVAPICLAAASDSPSDPVGGESWDMLNTIIEQIPEGYFETCPVDIDGDGDSDIDDLHELTKNPEDINGDGVADKTDLRCLENWLRSDTDLVPVPSRAREMGASKIFNPNLQASDTWPDDVIQGLVDAVPPPQFRCPFDADENGVVDIDDLNFIKHNPIDTNRDGIVNAEDEKCLNRYLRRNEVEDLQQDSAE